MIRAYKIEDKEQLIRLLQKNIPNYFHPSEELEYTNYLEKEIEDYFVFEEDGVPIGAGGINYQLEINTAYISWDLIDPKYHGKGLGKQLVQYRINHIKRNPSIATITVRTSQLTYLFYEKMGFQLKVTKKDFWAKGFDLYHMEIQITGIGPWEANFTNK